MLYCWQMIFGFQIESKVKEPLLRLKESDGSGKAADFGIFEVRVVTKEEDRDIVEIETSAGTNVGLADKIYPSETINDGISIINTRFDGKKRKLIVDIEVRGKLGEKKVVDIMAVSDDENPLSVGKLFLTRSEEKEEPNWEMLDSAVGK